MYGRTGQITAPFVDRSLWYVSWSMPAYLIVNTYGCSDRYSCASVGVGDYFEIRRTGILTPTHSFHYSSWESFKDHAYVDHLICSDSDLPTIFSSGTPGCRDGRCHPRRRTISAHSRVLFTRQTYTKVIIASSEWRRRLTIMWQFCPSGCSNTGVCCWDWRTHKVFTPLSCDRYLSDVRDPAWS